MFIRCPFCHRRIFFLLYQWHERKHTKLRPDGQMTDHVTLPPMDQYQGSLAGIPSDYFHPKCSAVTRMPEEIIRSYLSRPFMYGGGSFCGGCGNYPSYRELFWVGTNECLEDYFLKLQKDFVVKHDLDNPVTRGHYIAEAMKHRKYVAPDTPVLLLSPKAVQFLKTLPSKIDLPEPWYVRMRMCVPITNVGLGNLKLDLDGRADPYADHVSSFDGVKIVVLRDFVELLRGTEVDYDAERGGFTIVPPFEVI